MVASRSALLFATLVGAAHAANDWNTACTSGQCSYDLPNNNGNGASGTLKIWGNAAGISDITPAAGWDILSCDPSQTGQEIRLVCDSNSPNSGLCSNLLGGSGPEDKIVRLPESCGSNAFARVAQAGISSDQSIPASKSKRLLRRDGTTPQVRSLTLDTKWSAIDPKKYGNINFSVQASTAPGASTDVATPQRRAHPRQFYQRGLGDLFNSAVGAVGNAVNTAASDVGSAVNSAANAAGAAANAVGSAVDNAAKDAGAVVNNAASAASAVGNAVADAVTGQAFNFTKSDDLGPIDINKTFNLFDQKLDCGPVSAEVKADVTANIHADANVGLVTSGTVVPPAVTEFAVTVGFDAAFNATLDLTASATGNLDTGSIQLFSIGLPGLDFPGILQIGPTFTINAQATADLDAEIDLNVGLEYAIKNGQLVFPPQKNQGGGDFELQDTPITISVSPDVKADGTIVGHVIPAINLGVTAFDNVVNAKIFLNLDASATVTLNLEASDPNIPVANIKTRSHQGKPHAAQKGAANKGKKGKAAGAKKGKGSGAKKGMNAGAMKGMAAGSMKGMDTSSMKGMDASSMKGMGAMKGMSGSTKAGAAAAGAAAVGAATVAADVASSSNSTAAASKSDDNKGANDASNVLAAAASGVQFDGCIDISAGLAVNAGADADFFSLFDKSTSVTLFSKNFDLFKKCFGNAQNTRRAVSSRVFRSPVSSLVARQDLNSLVCPSADLSSPVEAISQVISAAAAKVL